MNVLDYVKFEIFSIAISIVLFYDLQWQILWKKILKIKSSYTKPFDCFRCNLFWITQIVFIFAQPSFIEYFQATILNLVVSFTYAKFINS